MPWSLMFIYRHRDIDAFSWNCKRNSKEGDGSTCIIKIVTRRVGLWLRKPYVASKGGVTRQMDAKMSQNTKYEVLEKLRWRYATAGPEHRRKLIDQAVEVMGYHRKSAIRALRGRKPSIVTKPGSKGMIGRPRLYEPELLLPVLRVIWLAGQQPCGRRLASMMPEWVPAYEAYHCRVASSVREQLLEVSSATLD